MRLLIFGLGHHGRGRRLGDRRHVRTNNVAPDGGLDLLDIALFVPPSILGFVCANEGWRYWSENRRITKHFQQ